MVRACIICGQASEPGASRCAQHQRSNWDRYKPAHAAVYKSQPWVDLRKRVLREQPVCAVEGCQERATSLDHIVALADGGNPYARENVRGMCAPHHRRRSSRQGAEARKRRKESSGRQTSNRE